MLEQHERRTILPKLRVRNLSSWRMRRYSLFPMRGWRWYFRRSRGGLGKTRPIRANWPTQNWIRAMRFARAARFSITLLTSREGVRAILATRHGAVIILKRRPNPVNALAESVLKNDWSERSLTWTGKGLRGNMSLQDWYYQRAKLIVTGESNIGKLNYTPKEEEIALNKIIMASYERYGDYWPILEKLGYRGYYRQASKILRFDITWRWTDPLVLAEFKPCLTATADCMNSNSPLKFEFNDESASSDITSGPVWIESFDRMIDYEMICLNQFRIALEDLPRLLGLR